MSEHGDLPPVGHYSRPFKFTHFEYLDAYRLGRRHGFALGRRWTRRDLRPDSAYWKQRLVESATERRRWTSRWLQALRDWSAL